jgi:succinate dehydrogenase hydrophobic membrane anchor protein
VTAETPPISEQPADVQSGTGDVQSAPGDVQSGSVTVSRVSRARVRPRGSRKELYIWYTMRVTAVALFVLALAHFSILHFIWDPASQNAQFIADERWNSIFWRGSDWLLLSIVLLHAFLGVRTVVIDYVHSPGWRTGTLWILYVIGVLLFILGTQVILTLPTEALTGPM